MTEPKQTEPLSKPWLGGSYRTQVVAALLLLGGCFGCDRVTKRAAEAVLPAGQRLSFLGDCLRLERVQNAGSFLGMGSGLDPSVRSTLFIWGVSMVVLITLVIAFHRRSSWMCAAGAALVASGGLGNLWDRITQGGVVTDFLNLGLGPLRTGIFNVADLAIVLGVVLLAIRRREGPTERASE